MIREYQRREKKEMKYSILLDVVGLEQKHIDSGLVPNIARLAERGEAAKLEPSFPAVTSTGTSQHPFWKISEGTWHNIKWIL